MKNLKYKNIDVFYKAYGKPGNPALVLLHGYLESMETWKNFAGKLQDEFYVITPDLPGHGLSGVFSNIHTMEELAETVKMIIDQLNIQKMHLIGHSMGGYVVLAFKELFPQNLLSFTLFHSHCFADPDEKKINRDRDIDMINSGKKELIVKNHVQKVFADINQDKFLKEKLQTKKIGMKTPDKGIIAVLNGLKNRVDRSHILMEGDIPGLLITGVRDNFIPESVNDKIISFSKNLIRADLENSGHMGLIEEEDKSVEILKQFLSQTTASQ